MERVVGHGAPEELRNELSDKEPPLACPERVLPQVQGPKIGKSWL